MKRLRSLLAVLPLILLFAFAPKTDFKPDMARAVCKKEAKSLEKQNAFQVSNEFFLFDQKKYTVIKKDLAINAFFTDYVTITTTPPQTTKITIVTTISKSNYELYHVHATQYGGLITNDWMFILPPNLYTKDFYEDNGGLDEYDAGYYIEDEGPWVGN